MLLFLNNNYCWHPSTTCLPKSSTAPQREHRFFRNCNIFIGKWASQKRSFVAGSCWATVCSIFGASKIDVISLLWPAFFFESQRYARFLGAAPNHGFSLLGPLVASPPRRPPRRVARFSVLPNMFFFETSRRYGQFWVLPEAPLRPDFHRKLDPYTLL